MASYRRGVLGHDAEPGQSAGAPLDAANLDRTGRRRLLWSYGLGDVGTGMGAALIGFYLMKFYLAAGLSPWMAGLAYGLGRFWDAINDPIVGWLSDKSGRSRWGPRLPWIVGSALPLGVTMALMWWLPPWPQPWIRFGVFLVISVLANSFYTGVNLPYTALASELTSDTRLRTRLNTARFTGSVISTLTATVLAGLLVRDLRDPSSFLPVGQVSGWVISVTVLLCGWGLLPMARRCRRPDSPRGSTRKLLRRVWSNQRFLMVLGLYLLLWCALQLMQATALIYLPVVMHLSDGLSKWILLPFMLSTLGGLWLWNGVAHRHGRLTALHWGGRLWIAACLIVMLLPPLQADIGALASPANSWRLLALLATIMLAGIGAASAYLIPWSLLPDAIDADPEKPAGQYSAWMVLGQKVCISAVLLFYGVLLSLSGYTDARGLEQPPSALSAIRLSMGIIPAVLVALGLQVMRRWPRRNRDSSGGAIVEPPAA